MLTNRVCFYDAPNLNAVQLPSEGAAEKATTLLDMPVVAKYATNAEGEPTFKGHEFHLDEEGNAHFGTESIGTHTEVYIAEDTVEMPGGLFKTLPCLFAKYKVWKRNPHVVSAIRRLFDLGKLYSSWEISTGSYEYRDGVKTITDYSFLGNALLGYEHASPAYGPSARAISLSALRPEPVMAQAMAEDLKTNKKEKKRLNEENNTPAAALDGQQENSAALTLQDLYERLTAACREKLDGWCYVAYMFPEEKTVWVKASSADSELDYLLFTYSVTDGAVVVADPVEVRLCVSLAEVNCHVDRLAQAVAQAGSANTALTQQVAELEQYRSLYEAARQEQAEAEKVLQREALASHVLSTGQISAAELAENEALAAMLDSLDKPGLDALVAQRLIDSLTHKAEPELAEARPASGKAELHTEGMDIHKTIMQEYLQG